MWNKMFSDSGEVSFSRFGTFLALTAGICWASHIVYTKDTIPDLGGLTAFILALYGMGKINETVQSFKKEGE